MTLGILGRAAIMAFFCLFVLFLYGPTLTIVILSFQGPDGGLTFPMNGVSLHWFARLFEPQAVGDFGGALKRSLLLALIVMAATVVISLAAGLAFRRRFIGANALFTLTIASLIIPSILVSLGIGLLFNLTGLDPAWYSSAFGAQLTWTLPFGLLDHVRGIQSLRSRLGGSRAWILAPRPGSGSVMSCCRSSRPVWSASRCSASPSPMTNSLARC